MQTVKNSLMVIGILLCILGAGLAVGSVLEMLTWEEAGDVFLKFVLIGVVIAVFAFLLSLIRGTEKK